MEEVKKVSIWAGIVIGIVAFIFIVSNMMPVIVNEPEIETELVWQKIAIWPAVGEASPGAGVSGFLEIYVINHTTVGANSIFAENTSATLEGWCVTNMPGHTPYASTDSFSVDIASEQQFDILVRGQFNRTHCWDGTKFRDDRVRINITFTCTEWIDGENAADENGSIVVVGNNTNWDCLYVNAFWNAADHEGYQIADDATLTISEISLEAKF